MSSQLRRCGSDVAERSVAAKATINKAIETPTGTVSMTRAGVDPACEVGTDRPHQKPATAVEARRLDRGERVLPAQLDARAQPCPDRLNPYRIEDATTVHLFPRSSGHAVRDGSNDFLSHASRRVEDGYARPTT